MASLELPRSVLKRHPVTANVIYDAVGIRMTKLPIKSEAVLAAIFEKQGRAVG